MCKWMIAHLYYSNGLVYCHRCVCVYVCVCVNIFNIISMIFKWAGLLSKVCVYWVFCIRPPQNAESICLKIYFFMHAMKKCPEGDKESVLHWKEFELKVWLKSEQKSSELSSPLLLCVAAEGWLQRVVILGLEAHVIEEIQLFETAQPVDSLTISHSKVRQRG